MTATLLDILMILSLGILAGTGTGLCLGFVARRRKPDSGAMKKVETTTNFLLILACSVIFSAVLAWYILWYPGG